MAQVNVIARRLRVPHGLPAGTELRDDVLFPFEQFQADAMRRRFGRVNGRDHFVQHRALRRNVLGRGDEHADDRRRFPVGNALPRFNRRFSCHVATFGNLL